MKKRLLFCAALAVALGAGAVTASHFSGNGLFGGLAKDNVESLASCELRDNDGTVIYACSGETDFCSLPSGTLTCSGKRVW